MEYNITISENTSISMHERILFLDSMRAIAIMMVVGVHSLGYCLPLPNGQREIILFIVHTISVPVFFLVDGYLFARSISYSKEYGYFNNIRKSITRLLVPWIVFTVIYLISRYFFELIGFLNEKLIVGHSFTEVIISAYGSVYAPQMYFLFSLFLIRLCNPIFKKFILIKQYVIVLFVFLCFLGVSKSSINLIRPFLKIDGGQEPIIHALWGIRYYFIGIILFKTTDIVKLEKLFVPFFLLFFVAFLMRDDSWRFGGVHIQYFYLVTFFLMFVFINDKLSFLNLIGKNTMGIFLIHAPIVLKAVSLFINEFISIPVLNYIAVLLVTLIFSICIVVAVNYLPYGPLLFGEANRVAGRFSPPALTPPGVRVRTG